jgi:predicted DNA-binding protein
MPFSLRLDPETEARIRRLARATGRSRSAVVREAVARYGARPASAGRAQSALDRVRPFAGVVTTNRQYSTDTHAKFRALLRRRRERRSR